MPEQFQIPGFGISNGWPLLVRKSRTPEIWEGQMPHVPTTTTSELDYWSITIQKQLFAISFSLRDNINCTK